MSRENIDLPKARRVLDKEHYGLEKVKERIVESLAVRKIAPDFKGQIICLVGPPGVGKTSIARSIAKAIGREYVRISLGGVRDEADIRGHRKTYVGAMPGRIISGLQQAGTRNPLFLLDEIDKMSHDFRGDPASAMLEVLDSEQNSTFTDHYLEVPFDLSDVMFMTTANSLDTIPSPLLDRMEVIELSSYTRLEKYHIAREHLVPKQMKKHNLKAAQLRFAESGLYGIIDGYTREAGVRNLERTIASVCRKAATAVADGEEKRMNVSAASLEKLLGPRRFFDDALLAEDEVGVVNGLAWTAVGGTLLQVEVNVMEGSGKLELTGSLGNVMKESAHAAVSFIRSHAEVLGVPADFYKTRDIHIHVPEGATPKDGPSAGVTMATALVSALTGRPVRREVAMTGEITLRGRVLAIGGLKEKSMAAYSAGVKTVIIPKANEPDLAKIDAAVREGVRFVPVTRAEQAIETALLPLLDAAVEKTPYPHRPSREKTSASLGQ